MKVRMMQLFLLFGLSVSYAAQTPIFQFTPLTPTTVEIGAGETATVSYRVTNLLPQAKRLAWKPISSISQDTSAPNSCIASNIVASGGSCVLTLSTTSIISAVPEICNTTASGTFNPFYCSRSSDEDRMVTTRKIVEVAPISLSPSTLSLIASGSSGTITVSNLSETIVAENIRAHLEGTDLFGKVTQNASDCENVAPLGTCALVFTPGDEAVNATNFLVYGDNTSRVSATISISSPPVAPISVTGSPLILETGASGTLTVTNDSTTVTAFNISADLSGALADAGVTQNATGCSSVNPGASCNLVITAGDTVIVPTSAPVSGANTTTASSLIGVEAPPLQEIELTAGSPLVLVANGSDSGTMTITNRSDSAIAAGVTAHFEGTALNGNVSADTCGIITAGGTCILTFTSTGTTSVPSTDFPIYGDGTTEVTGNITLFNRYAYVTLLNDDAVRKCLVDTAGAIVEASCSNTGSELSRPIGIVLNNGYAYIANNITDTVTKCTVSAPNGELIGCAHSPLLGTPFNKPRGLLIHNNYAYVMSFAGDAVTKCDVSPSDGELSNCNDLIETFSRPQDIAISNGHAYITSRNNNTVTKCDVNPGTGALLNCTVTPNPAMEPDPGFNGPYGIIINNGYAYVTNFLGEDVSKCNVDAVSGELSSCNPTGTGFLAPINTFINNGYAYTTNFSDDSVSKCTVNPADGSLIDATCASTGGTFTDPGFNYIYLL